MIAIPRPSREYGGISLKDLRESYDNVIICTIEMICAHFWYELAQPQATGYMSTFGAHVQKRKHMVQA
jgi:hypothetical protein